MCKNKGCGCNIKGCKTISSHDEISIKLCTDCEHVVHSRECVDAANKTNVFIITNGYEFSNQIK